MNDKQLLDWDALIALKAVAEKGTLKAAADSLDRVPSAISYQIRKLEQQVGAKLLEKTGKRVVFTPAGRALMKEIPALMETMQATIQNVQQVAHGWEASLTLAVESILPLPPVLEIISEFRQLNAPTRINLRRETLAGTWDAVLSGRADIAIGAGDPIPEQFQLRTFKLGSVEMVACCAPDFPLAETWGQPDVNQDDYTMVVLTDSAAQLPRRRAQVHDTRNSMAVTTLQDKLEAQLAGLGYGHLPRWLAQPHIEKGDLVALGEPEQTPTLHVAWRKTDKGRALKWFVEALESLKLPD